RITAIPPESNCESSLVDEALGAEFFLQGGNALFRRYITEDHTNHGLVNQRLNGRLPVWAIGVQAGVLPCDLLCLTQAREFSNRVYPVAVVRSWLTVVHSMLLTNFSKLIHTVGHGEV